MLEWSPMKKKEKNYAFIDSQNLNLSIQDLGWKLDYIKFRKYLTEKYAVERAFMFLGKVEGNEELYDFLKEAGFDCIFKPTLTYKDGTTKGNCDAELVLHTMLELPNYDQAVVVTGDGDFHCLVKVLIDSKRLKKLLIPSQKHYSALLKRFPSEYVSFISDLRRKLSYRKPRKKKSSK